MSQVLDKLSLCTYSSGDKMVREVLGDWLQFLGGRPSQVIFVVSPAIGVPPVYEELRKEGVIDRLILLDPRGRSARELEPDAIRLAVDAAATDWVLLFKLDTLPYRSGNENWLSEVMEMIDKHGLVGMTGSWQISHLIPLESGYCTTQKFSNNFSLIQKKGWLDAIDSDQRRAPGSSTPLKPEFHGNDVRFLTEYLIESDLEQTGKRLLVKNESLDWSVFHVNVWGEQLRKVRNSYLERKGVKRYLNTAKPPWKNARYPWQIHYGFPRPPLVTRIRITLGRWRRDLLE
jgi:hypothetical protein